MIENSFEAGGPLLNILLVEDHEADVAITLRAFAKARIKTQVQVVTNGQEALDFLKNEGAFQDRKRYPRPDLILLDLNMPKLDGFQFLDTVKKDGPYGAIPVVIFTSSANPEDVRKGYAKGAASYIQKPVDYDHFIRMVDAFNVYWQVFNTLPQHGGV